MLRLSPVVISAAALLAVSGAMLLALPGSQASGPKQNVQVAADAEPGTTIEAPYTRVEAGRRVHVDAPYASVDVNTERRRVRVQAPFVDLDVKR
jgi:hypothetical protein